MTRDAGEAATGSAGRWRGWAGVITRTAARVIGLACALVCAHGCGGAHEVRQAGGDPAAGRMLLSSFGCGECHRIPGAVGATGTLGPSLESWRSRTYIAGRTLNTQDALVSWIVDPQGIDPGNAMPNLGVKPEEARHMAAYLYSMD
jgi:cytochrome c